LLPFGRGLLFGSGIHGLLAAPRARGRAHQRLSHDGARDLCPVFAFCLAVLAITWASRYRFVVGDCPCVQRLLRRVTRLHVPAPEEACHCASTAQKAAFWAIVVLALPLILSIVLSMFPLFGTYYQELALAIHRWTSIAFFVAVIVHTYLAVRVRFAQ